MSIKAYLFDMDGTLANSELHYAKAIQRLMEEHGYKENLKEIGKKIAGAEIDCNVQYVVDKIGGDFNEIKNILLERAEYSPFDYKDYIYEDSFEVIKALKKQGYKLALCTINRNERVENFLSCGFKDLFECFVNPETYPCRNKPEPDIYLTAMKLLNVKAEECIIVEDSIVGIESGKRSGAYVIANKECGFDVDVSRADKTIDNLVELIKNEKR